MAIKQPTKILMSQLWHIMFFFFYLKAHPFPRWRSSWVTQIMKALSVALSLRFKATVSVEELKRKSLQGQWVIKAGGSDLVLAVGSWSFSAEQQCQLESQQSISESAMWWKDSVKRDDRDNRTALIIVISMK